MIFVVAVSGLFASDANSGSSAAAPDVRMVPLTRVIRMPVRILSSTPVQNTDPAALTIAPGAADERPEGPDGFDVLEDGTVVVTDPLRNRIATFDSQGRFKQTWKIGFAADSITSLGDGLILVREASTGRTHVFSREGKEVTPQPYSLPQLPEARIVNGTSGIVMRQSVKNLPVTPLPIQLERAGSALVSIEVLGIDSQGNTYVALEASDATRDTEEANVDKFVRKYSTDGKVVGQIGDISLNYYVTPVDELRVHRGVVYQLLTTNSEVRINVWDMN